MDIYEKATLLAIVPGFSWLRWKWKPLGILMLLVAIVSLTAVEVYQGNLAMADSKSFLKYLRTSQSTILWMSTLFLLPQFSIWEDY